ncbi:MAG TPA: hypothetical protein VKZ53_18340 [Candidatus Angelobacter sp.]|nr:hypothetical protein [Candidatus Angelobacter sp.]
MASGSGSKIKGISGMTPQELSFEVNRGGKFIRYRYCVSVIVVTMMQGTDIYFVKQGENRVAKGLPWILLTSLAGWWGIPWGPIRSVHSLWINFRGGDDLTAAVVNAMGLKDINWAVAGAAQNAGQTSQMNQLPK